VVPLVPLEHIITFTELEAALKQPGVSVQSLPANEQTAVSLRKLLRDINVGHGLARDTLPEDVAVVIQVSKEIMNHRPPSPAQVPVINDPC
jgi:hypothetical protein